jgi:N-hydroxyarylamine O-acetyltransferase
VRREVRDIVDAHAERRRGDAGGPILAVPVFALDAYLARIGHTGPLSADADTLFALHRSHVDAIPFENLDIQMGRGISLDPVALQAKLVGHRRGGYCFEQNRLFAMALESAGFAVSTLEARVRARPPGALLPRTHMVLGVALGGRRWLADVGFGGDGLIEPVRVDGGDARQLESSYRVRPEGPLSVLQRRTEAGWEDLYAVLPDPVHPIDFEVANWYTSTHPDSAFVLTLTAQRITNGARHVLRNLTYSVVRGAARETTQIARTDLVPLLAGTFGIDVPAAQTFRALDG